VKRPESDACTTALVGGNRRGTRVSHHFGYSWLRESRNPTKGGKRGGRCTVKRKKVGVCRNANNGQKNWQSSRGQSMPSRSQKTNPRASKSLKKEEKGQKEKKKQKRATGHKHKIRKKKKKKQIAEKGDD